MPIPPFVAVIPLTFHESNNQGKARIKLSDIPITDYAGCIQIEILFSLILIVLHTPKISNLQIDDCGSSIRQLTSAMGYDSYLSFRSNQIQHGETANGKI
jgi:hypothetical protein